MALEVIREIVGFGENLVGRLVMLDASAMRFETLRYGWENIAGWKVSDTLRLKAGLAYTRSVFREGPFAGSDVPLVSRWTGIPVDRMLEGEKDKLLRMEEALAKRVVGQTEAVKAVSTAVRRALFRPRGRPSGTIPFASHCPSQIDPISPCPSRPPEGLTNSRSSSSRTLMMITSC